MTPRPLRAVYLNAIRDATPTAGSSALADIGVWDGAAYQVLVENIQIRISTSIWVQPGLSGPFYCDLPAGARLGARLQSTAITAVDRTFTATLIGLEA